ncbi:flagellar operon protein [Marinilactibacillus piezotolerans]|uniref:Flagellar operon protein n=1 Tax=Marinilactibacillus piezotolerans TaxID=258723 RepID=A0A1I3V6Q6_9LACT|nr:TIGR02530 family flagellar biosynthesis protein [Marinilactibacillus piezotolerans]SFJ90975.1 flagellar operon protein [Marinilactibacillus piezotolerans]
MIDKLSKSIETSQQSFKTKQPSIQLDRKFGSFIEDALKNANTEAKVTFSNHAQKRLDQHGISLDQTDLNNLEEAVQTLADKGSKQSLILYDDLALIASIKNRKVITALKSDEMNEVTNIDSAIQVKRDV